MAKPKYLWVHWSGGSNHPYEDVNGWMRITTGYPPDNEFSHRATVALVRNIPIPKKDTRSALAGGGPIPYPLFEEVYLNVSPGKQKAFTRQMANPNSRIRIWLRMRELLGERG